MLLAQCFSICMDFFYALVRPLLLGDFPTFLVFIHACLMLKIIGAFYQAHQKGSQPVLNYIRCFNRGIPEVSLNSDIPSVTKIIQEFRIRFG